MTLEAVLWAPLLIGCVMVVVFGFRLVEARDEVSTISNAAARAASLAPDPDTALGAGRSAAREALGAAGRSCRGMDVDIDTSQFQAGGVVRATVTCHADLSDISGFGIPGAKTFTHTAVVPIETHRVL